MQHKTDKKMV